MQRTMPLATISMKRAPPCAVWYLTGIECLWPATCRQRTAQCQKQAARRGAPMNESTADKRRRLREHGDLCAAVHRLWQERGYQHPPPHCPALPADLIGLTCGAKTRAGTPCKLTTLYDNGRCKWHGGCSTGPKTEAGKEQARINGRKGGRPKKPKL